MADGRFDWQFISYADAVHAFTNPGADKIHATRGMNVGYNEAAARRSWQHMRVFFNEIFGR
jgi:dienelactone hydrolase